MFLRHKIRRKDGKEHRYWSIVENRRVSGGRTVQRHVLYLGEINDAQKVAWCQTIEAFDEGGQQARQIALFPEDRAAPALNCDVVHVRLRGCLETPARVLNLGKCVESKRSPIAGAFDVDTRDPGRA